MLHFSPWRGQNWTLLPTSSWQFLDALASLAFKLSLSEWLFFLFRSVKSLYTVVSAVSTVSTVSTISTVLQSLQSLLSQQSLQVLLAHLRVNFWAFFFSHPIILPLNQPMDAGWLSFATLEVCKFLHHSYWPLLQSIRVWQLLKAVYLANPTP